METEKIVGLILDLSSAQQDGISLLKIVKKQLITFLKQFTDGEDLVYLYDDNDYMMEIGKIVAAISNYTQFKLDLRQALMKTFYFVGSEDYEKYIIVISNRSQNRDNLQRFFKFVERQHIDVNVVFVILGNEQLDCKDCFVIELGDATKIARNLLDLYGKKL